MGRSSVTGILIAIVIFAAIGAGGVTLIGGMNDHYGDMINTSEFNSSFGEVTLDNMESKARTIEGDVDPATSESGQVNYEEGSTDIGYVFKKIPSFIKQAFNSVKLATTAAGSANKQGVLNGMVPSWFISTTIIIIIFVIIGAIISMLLRKEV